MSRPAATDSDGAFLYVGVDEEVVRLIGGAFGGDRHTVEHAADAAAGLARVARGGVTAVVLDLGLDASSALEFLGDLNRLPNPPPVVYLTASTEATVAADALKAGAADLVVKTAGPHFQLQLLAAQLQLLAAVEQSREYAKLQLERERLHSEVREERDRAIALLDKLNHRVANSLALVGSLVRMQAAATPDANVKSVLDETQARIAAVANLHRTLSTSEDTLVVDLADYLPALVEELRHSIAAEGRAASLSVSAVGARISTEKAVAVGMIATELIANAIKYAYPGGSGEVRLRLEHDAVGGRILFVEDDGVGFSRDLAEGAGLGARIVGAMARSLGAELEFGTLTAGAQAFLRLSPDLFDDRRPGETRPAQEPRPPQ